MSLRDDLIGHEGLELKVYLDSEGISTIGVGRNLEDNGISKEEAMMLLDNDILSVVSDCKTFWWYSSLDPVRQDVIANMVFNLGLTRFSKFKKTITHIGAGNYESAADEMLDSKWAVQVKSRATQLSKMMREG